MKIKKSSIIVGLASIILFTGLYFQSCAPSKEIQAKSGAQLWGENCIRCHNIPSPTDFSDAQWDLIGSHMRIRANLTMVETEKIIGFLKLSN